MEICLILKKKSNEIVFKMSIDPNAKKYLSLKKKFSEKFKSVSTRVDPVPGPPQYSHVF